MDFLSFLRFLEMLGKIGIENLNLKGNKICNDEDYEEKVDFVIAILEGRRPKGSLHTSLLTVTAWLDLVIFLKNPKIHQILQIFNSNDILITTE